jgi:peptidoglycan hydrolase CwlO-like protein
VQLKKDLDELQKKLENANVESNSLQERIRETEREIDETKKKIK